MCEGSLEPVAEAVFAGLPYDSFLVEWDDMGRDGGFEPLRFLRPGSVMVMGLISSKVRELESEDDLMRRMDEAAAIAGGIDRLAISPNADSPPSWSATTPTPTLSGASSSWSGESPIASGLADRWPRGSPDATTIHGGYLGLMSRSGHHSKTAVLPWLRPALLLLALGTVGCGGAAAATGGPANSAASAQSSAPTKDAGSMIAFDCGDVPDICVMDPDGSGVRRLAVHPANDEDPSWSPDGRRIAFASSRYDGRTGRNQIYVMNADGSHVERLTRGAGGKFEPDWSPSETRLAFVGDREGNFDIYVMNVDGSGVTNLTKSPASESDRAWSPDGRSLVYTVGVGARPQIWVMDSGGSGARKLGSGFAADWSPDGSRLAFSTGFGIAVASLQDGSVTRLTGEAYDLEPTWSPDSERIVFRRGRMDDNADLYSIASDGGQLTRLTGDLQSRDDARLVAGDEVTAPRGRVQDFGDRLMPRKNWYSGRSPLGEGEQ